MDIALISDIVDYGVLGILGFMSFLVLFYWIERLLFYRGVILESYESLDMTSLALALKATAMGLVVAIPAIFFYNHLNRKCDVLTTRWKIMQRKRSQVEQ